MRYRLSSRRHAFLGAALLAALPTLASAQNAQADARGAQPLTVSEAVRLALEHNLGIRIARIDPQVQDLIIAQVRASWRPIFMSSFANTSTESPTNSFLSGGVGPSISDDRLIGTAGLQQSVPRWGGRYTLGWDTGRSLTTNVFSNFNPQMRSSFSFSFTQPLLRNFSIDSVRQQLLAAEKSREIADLGLQSTVLNTTRSVRNAYWELVSAIASLDMHRQSLELAREQLRNNRARIEIGTLAPIDIVEAESEVGQREEAVILGEAEVERAEDALRTQVYDPQSPDFWTIGVVPADAPPFEPMPLDIDRAVRRALEQRTDLLQARRRLESTETSIRFARDQTLPEVNAQFDYGLVGLGGTQLLRGPGFPGEIVGETTRSFGSVLGDLVTHDFPTWTLAVNVSYPIGNSQQEANLARARLQYSQSQTQLRSEELQVTTQVRDLGRQVRTNQRRVGTTRVSRELAQRRLDAEQKKFAAGTSTSFFVFQAQRDLSQAQNNELRAILDYNKSVVDFETVQEAPLGQ